MPKKACLNKWEKLTSLSTFFHLLRIFFVCVWLPWGKQHKKNSRCSAGMGVVIMGLSSLDWQSWCTLQPSYVVEKNWKKCPRIINVNTLMVYPHYIAPFLKVKTLYIAPFLKVKTLKQRQTVSSWISAWGTGKLRDIPRTQGQNKNVKVSYF